MGEGVVLSVFSQHIIKSAKKKKRREVCKQLNQKYMCLKMIKLE